MERNIICLLILWVFVAGCKSSVAQQSQKDTQEIENIIARNAGALLEDQRFHALSVGIYLDGKVVTAHFGELDLGKGNPPNDKTLYEIASVTKTFLGTLVAKAVLDGKIDLQDDVRKYLDRPYPNLEFEGQPIRIQHILTHTSGFPNFPIKGDSKPNFFDGLEEIVIESPPGKTFSYSNTAPELMAYILEQVYGEAYEKLVSTYILEPLRMKETTFTLDEGQRERLIQGYSESGERMPNFERTLWGGTAGLHSTVPDLLKYIAWHLDESQPVVRESHRNFFSTRFDFDIGYHWNLVEREGEPVCRHHGGIFGMQNWLMVYPRSQMGISIFTNVSFEETGSILEEVGERICREIAALD